MTQKSFEALSISPTPLLLKNVVYQEKLIIHIRLLPTPSFLLEVNILRFVAIIKSIFIYQVYRLFLTILGFPALGVSLKITSQ
ncbi:hypothetical protein [Okeania sp.]|uniref:hypothetical protein n=1 Tax=Okeania sp. TaxID=3100323 RepID=UPI002B4ABC03|nr:hypothetical protein [Okeania sp.]